MKLFTTLLFIVLMPMSVMALEYNYSLSMYYTKANGERIFLSNDFSSPIKLDEEVNSLLFVKDYQIISDDQPEPALHHKSSPYIPLITMCDTSTWFSESDFFWVTSGVATYDWDKSVEPWEETATVWSPSAHILGELVTDYLPHHIEQNINVVSYPNNSVSVLNFYITDNSYAKREFYGDQCRFSSSVEEVVSVQFYWEYCVDSDGDGHSPPTDTCPDGTDGDDTDPEVFDILLEDFPRANCS